MSKQDKSASLWRNGITLMGWFLGWALGLLGVVLLGLDLAHGHTSSCWALHLSGHAHVAGGVLRPGGDRTALGAAAGKTAFMAADFSGLFVCTGLPPPVSHPATTTPYADFPLAINRPCGRLTVGAARSLCSRCGGLATRGATSRVAPGPWYAGLP